jgi:hypothetical protein
MVNEVVGWVTVSVLGFFILAIFGGMFFGMIRGTKRTLKRTLVLVAFFTLALVLTPFVSRGLLASPLGGMLKDLVGDAVGENDVLTSVENNMADIYSFAWNLPLAIINLVIYAFVMLPLMRFVVAPIFSAIFLRSIARKRDADGNKKKHSKLAGLGMGAVQGFVVFAFVFVPVLGLMSSLNKIDKYEPSFNAISFDVMDTGMKPLNEMNQFIRDVNTGVQKGTDTPIGIKNPIGPITNYTGLQWFGDRGLAYLTTVKAGKKNIEMKREIEIGFQLSRDVPAIIKMVSEIDEVVDLVAIFSDKDNVEYFESVINKVFKLGTVNLLLDANYNDLVEDLELIHGVSGYGNEFEKSMYTGMGAISAKQIQSDLLSALEVTRLVFAKHNIEGVIGEQISLYEEVDKLIYAMRNDATEQTPLYIDGIPFKDKTSAMNHVFENVGRALKQVEFDAENNKKRNLAEQIFNVFGSLNLFTEALVDPENPDMHSIPLGRALRINPEDAIIGDFVQVMDGMANIVVRIVDIGPLVYQLSSTSDPVKMAQILKDDGEDGIVALGQILEILTNTGKDGIYISQPNSDNPQEVRVMGVGNIFRVAIGNFLTEWLDRNNNDTGEGEENPENGFGSYAYGDSDGAGGGSILDFNKIIESLVDKLAPGGAEKDIAWVEELGVIVDIVGTLGDLLNGDPQELLERLLGGDLLELIAESDLLAGAVVNALDGALNNALKDTGVEFDFGGVDSSEVILALASLADGGKITELLDGDGGLADASSFEDVNALVALLGGDGKGEDSAIVMLANSGLVINVVDADGSLQYQLDNYTGDAAVAAAIKKLIVPKPPVV